MKKYIYSQNQSRSDCIKLNMLLVLSLLIIDDNVFISDMHNGAMNIPSSIYFSFVFEAFINIYVKSSFISIQDHAKHF